MPVSIQKARSLCTKSELDLLHWSRSPDLVDLPPSRIKQKIARSRKLRDKFRDLADRQRRESRRKEGPRGKRPSESNDATRTKQQLFQEALERFEAALVKHNAAVAKKASKKKTSKKTTKKISKKTLMKKASKASAKPAKKVSKKKTASLASALQSEQKAWNKSARAVSSQSEGKRKSMKFSRTGQPKIQGHVSSRTRRNQAKRDARG
jgi:hypothetical protein